MLEDITPIILTWNEEPNLGRSLKQLYWAKTIVVVDSFSADKTADIVSRYSNINFFQRSFDTHSSQWNFALKETNINTDWVLALDADYILTDDFIEEIKALKPDQCINGYRTHFIYYSLARALRGNLYPPATILYRRIWASYVQDGHTQRVVVQGKIENLHAKVMHQDRKSVHAWFSAQCRYADLETRKILSLSWANLGWPDRVRRFLFLAPPLIFFYCLLVKGLILDGFAGLWYSMQRLTAELILSFFLIKYCLLSITCRKRFDRNVDA